MTPTALLAVSAISSVASGAVGYLGAQRQAEGLEQQAKSAEQMAAHNAQIARNNALGQAQDLQHQASVQKFNQKVSQQQTSSKLEQLRTKERITSAKLTASGAKRGVLNYSFSDALKSRELLASREEAAVLFEGAQQGYQFGTQANLNQLMANRAIEQGRTQSGVILAEGRFTSSSLQNQASGARIGGIGSLVGGVAQGASAASQIQF